MPSRQINEFSEKGNRKKLMLMAMMRMLLLMVKTLKSASLTGGQGLITRESGRLTVWWIE